MKEWRMRTEEGEGNVRDRGWRGGYKRRKGNKGKKEGLPSTTNRLWETC
jgi:hypothetical protein